MDFRKNGLLLTSQYDLSPRKWGCIGFSHEPHRKSFLGKTTAGTIVAIYITKNKGPKEKRYKVVGFVELSGEIGNSQDFILPAFWEENQKKRKDDKNWEYGIRIVRAWEVIESDWKDVEYIFPNTYRSKLSQVIGAQGVKVDEADFVNVEKLEIYEVPVYRQNQSIETEITSVKEVLAKPSRAGPISSGGYSVGESDGPRHLYILRLKGCPDSWLGRESENKIIIKVGFSKSPTARCHAIQSNYPSGQFEWEVMFPRQFNNPHAPNGKIAIKGEDAMKEFLKHNAESLGGEFYLVSEDLCKTCFDAGLDAINFRA